MYRNVIPVAKSVYRLSSVHPTLRLIYSLGSLHAELSKMVMDFIGFDGSAFRVRMDTDWTYGAVLFGLTTSAYVAMRSHGFDVSGLRYEDLTERPLDICRVLMEFCGLPVSLAEHAVKALDVDSQRNSYLSKSNIGHFKEPDMTPEMKAKLNELLKRYPGAPLIGEPCMLEGTLTG